MAHLNPIKHRSMIFASSEVSSRTENAAIWLREIGFRDHNTTGDEKENDKYRA